MGTGARGKNIRGRGWEQGKEKKERRREREREREREGDKTIREKNNKGK
jgi:hypothetical protein